MNRTNWNQALKKIFNWNSRPLFKITEKKKNEHISQQKRLEIERRWHKHSNTAENRLFTYCRFTRGLVKSKAEQTWIKVIMQWLSRWKWNKYLCAFFFLFFAFMMFPVAQNFKPVVFESRNEILRLGWVEFCEGLILVMNASLPSAVLFTTNLLALTLGLHEGFLYCRVYKEKEKCL